MPNDSDAAGRAARSPSGQEAVRAEPEAGLRVTRSVLVPEAELRWRFSASGGPGGQHANTSNTRAEVTFDIASSIAFTDAQRDRVMARLGPSITVVASDERSQLRNRGLAIDRLKGRLADALHVERPRRPSKPTRGSTERRLASKSERGKRKAERSFRPDAD